MSRLLQDLRYALRQLAKAPSFTTTALLTLALGIGANVVVFGVRNTWVLRPRDVPRPAGLYNIAHAQQNYDNQSYPEYLDLQARNNSFRDMAAYRFGDAGVSAGTVTCKCWFYKVSGNYVDMVGAQPFRGRMLHATDEHGPNSAIRTAPLAPSICPFLRITSKPPARTCYKAAMSPGTILPMRPKSRL